MFFHLKFLLELPVRNQCNYIHVHKYTLDLKAVWNKNITELVISYVGLFYKRSCNKHCRLMDR